MRKALAISCALLLSISSLFVADGMVPLRRPDGFKRLYRDKNFQGTSEFALNDDGNREMQQRDQAFRRSICLSARELDCERELQDQ
ncbi:hypothetical protein ACROYT_G025179 [Oculina patagonica]